MNDDVVTFAPGSTLSPARLLELARARKADLSRVVSLCIEAEIAWDNVVHTTKRAAKKAGPNTNERLGRTSDIGRGWSIAVGKLGCVLQAAQGAGESLRRDVDTLRAENQRKPA